MNDDVSTFAAARDEQTEDERRGAWRGSQKG
jgi:hypothetical protein